MGIVSSFLYSLKSSRYNPLTFLHALFYARTIGYLRLLRWLVDLPFPAIRKHVVETYHAKVVRLADARTIISINRDIDFRNLEQLLPYRYARDLILKNPCNIVIYHCPCRAQQEHPCQPTEVCLIIGEPFADLLRLFQPFRSRRISQAEALRILQEEDDRGHVHTAWFKQTMLNRFYAICNCCKCCCLGMQFMQKHGMHMIQPSGYRAHISEQCVGCGTCAQFCQFEAIQVITDSVESKYGISAAKCYGCGVCEGKCPNQAISLVRSPETGPPLDIIALETAQQARSSDPP